MISNPLHNSPRLEELYNQYSEKVDLGNKIKGIKKKISEGMAIQQLDELKCRKRVLRRFGFINEAEVVQLKARVACEISTGDELMLSELLFNGFFNKLTPEQAASVLSVFVFEEKTKETPALSKDELSKPPQGDPSASTDRRQSRTGVKTSSQRRRLRSELPLGTHGSYLRMG